jgi:hypothetical protein
MNLRLTGFVLPWLEPTWDWFAGAADGDPDAVSWLHPARVPANISTAQTAETNLWKCFILSPPKLIF